MTPKRMEPTRESFLWMRLEQQIMGILTWVVMGLAVGLLASRFSKSNGARRLTILIASLAGALIGWLNVAFLYRVPGAFYDLNWMVAAASLVGAILAVLLFGLLRPQKVTVE